MEDETELDPIFEKIECKFDLTPFPDGDLQFNEKDYEIFNNLDLNGNLRVFYEERGNCFADYYKDTSDDVTRLKKEFYNYSNNCYIKVVIQDNEIVHQQYSRPRVYKLFRKSDKFNKETKKIINTETLESIISQENENPDIVNKVFIKDGKSPVVTCTKKPDGIIIMSYFHIRNRSTRIRTQDSEGTVIYSSRPTQ